MSDGIPLGGGAPTFPGGMSADDLAALLKVLQGPQSAGPASAGMPGQPMPQQAPTPQLQLPTLLGLQPPEMSAPQQAAPAPGPAQLPSLTKAPPPAMSPAGGNNGNPPGIPPTAKRVTMLGPTAPSGVDDNEDEPNANLPMVRATPLPPARPPEFGSSATPGPTEAGAIATGAPAFTGPASSASKPNGPPVAPQTDDGGFDLGRALKRFGDAGGGDYLMALGAGIAGGRNWGEGLSAGFSNASRVGAQQQASQLAQAEYALKVGKLRQEQGALTGNAAILKRAYPNLSDAEIAAMATNSSNVTTALQILRDPTHGMPKSV